MQSSSKEYDFFFGCLLLLLQPSCITMKKDDGSRLALLFMTSVDASDTLLLQEVTHEEEQYQDK